MDLEAKQGYKQTEVGLIPDDWEVRYFDEIGETIIGLTYSPNDVSSSGKLVHRSSNIQNNKLSFEDNVFVSSQVPDKLILRENDILICVRNGSKRLIGKSALIKGKSVGETFGAFMSVFRPDVYAPIVYQYFISNIVQSQISASLGATINQITNKTLKEFKTPLPPTLEEQKAIATALTDVDNLITNLDDLIAKKKAIKQGAMQQLLTPPDKGGKRLDCFDGEWLEISIGELCKNIIDYRGVTPKKLGMDWGDGEIVALSAGNVKKGYIDYDSECYYGSEALYKRWMRNGDAKKGDIVFTLEAPLGNIALIPDDKKYILSQRTILLQMDVINYSSPFVYQVLVSDNFQNYISSSATGSTAQGIKRTTFEKLKIDSPKSLKEQKAIAQILSDMDKELEELATKKEKYEHIKQGMMQELLTGKTRLV